MEIPKVGLAAPAFVLPDESGTMHALADYRGKWVLLYFYPKDDTPGCTTQACAIRDQFNDFTKIGAVVLGVSTDSVASHKKFKAAYELPFTLLADEHKEVVGEYGIARRTSFLIDPDGKIAKVYEKVKPEQHAGEVIADLKELSA